MMNKKQVKQTGSFRQLIRNLRSQAHNSHEFTCKKCGQICVIEYDRHEAYWPTAWCDECEDYPQGFVDAAGGLQADYVAGIADTALDSEKYANL